MYAYHEVCKINAHRGVVSVLLQVSSPKPLNGFLNWVWGEGGPTPKVVPWIWIMPNLHDRH